MSDLREQITEQIYKAFWSAKPPIRTEVAVYMAATKHFDSPAAIDKAWLAMADEVLRLMEWAAEQEGQRNTGAPHRLILPPPEWKR